MPVTDFECQIARGQIGRYLGGGVLSPDAMRGLEDHLAECPGCKTLVSDRRAALLGMLGGDIPTTAVVSMPVREENPLVAALRAKQEAEVKIPFEEPKTKTKATPRHAKVENSAGKPVMTKPILLGGLLAIVLLGMNFMSRANNGKGALGDRASDTFAATTLASKPEDKKTVAESKPTDTKPVEAPTKPVDTAVKPITPAVTKPIDETAADSAETHKPEAPKTEPVKTEAPKVVPVKTEPVKPIAPKAVAPKPVAKPVVKPVVKLEVKKPVASVHVKKIHRAARKRVVARKVRVKRAARTSVRVYGLDGHPLK